MTVTTITLILGFISIVGILYQHFENEIYNQLETEVAYISAGIETYGEYYLDNLKTDQRITLIDQSGEVVYDNHATSSEMENHALREEVIEAYQVGVGKSERYSETLQSKTLYYAVSLNNGYILRIADYQNTIFVLVLQMIQPISIVLLIALGLAWYISKKLAKQITEPINSLDLDAPNISIEYKELDPLLTRIQALTDYLLLQVEDAVKQQEEFKMITDHMTEGFVVINKDLTILSYNESICRQMDIKEDIKGKDVYILNDDKAFARFIERTMKGGHNDWIQEKDGRYYQWISNPVKTDDVVGGAVIVMMDVTEKAKRDQFRSEFTANISHELKTPLTSISGFAEIIENGIVREEDVKVFAGDIYRESQRLIQLVNDIIRISQLDDHRLVYQKEMIDVRSEIDIVIERLKHIAKKKNISIHCDGNEFRLYTVSSVFQDVIYNLIDNAIKYNKENGEVFIHLDKDNQYFILSIKDTGIGIPVHDQERIFERFYRVDKSRSSQNGGTGLGLSIVKHGVTTLNGIIELKSILHEGTEIKIKLPIQE